MRKILILLLIIILTGCSSREEVLPADIDESAELEEDEWLEEEENSQEHEGDTPTKPKEEEGIGYQDLKDRILDKYQGIAPSEWGENLEGVISEIQTDEKIVALTFDACDGSPNSYDKKLIDFLIQEEVPATLFIGGQWIKENQAIFMELAGNPLFEIANHGYHHKPLSVTGERAYNIEGTKSVEDAFDEIYKNQMLIKELTGSYPKYFRSGTAYYDDVAVEIIQDLDLKAVNYNVLGDAGGTYNKKQIVKAFETAKEGSIFLFHMNQPHSEICKGVQEGVRLLKERGFSFVQLGEYDEFLK